MWLFLDARLSFAAVSAATSFPSIEQRYSPDFTYQKSMCVNTFISFAVLD
jgi:hypothetical protein